MVLGASQEMNDIHRASRAACVSQRTDEAMDFMHTQAVTTATPLNANGCHMPAPGSAPAGRAHFASACAIDLMAGNIGADNDPFSYISRAG